ncbi:MAG: hypothetical protein AAGD01_02255 [Acidobacteriota bacterium]
MRSLRAGELASVFGVEELREEEDWEPKLRASLSFTALADPLERFPSGAGVRASCPRAELLGRSPRDGAFCGDASSAAEL